jgi:hypothetical protein
MDNKSREIPAIFPAFGYALSSPGEGRRRRAWDGPPPHNASIEGPDSPLQKGGKHWGRDRSSLAFINPSSRRTHFRSRKDTRENNELSWPWSDLPALYSVRAALSRLAVRTAAEPRQVLHPGMLLRV